MEEEGDYQEPDGQTYPDRASQPRRWLAVVLKEHTHRARNIATREFVQAKSIKSKGAECK